MVKQIKSGNMKAEYFIDQVEIENFRCFKHLKVDGLKRVNLIGGDNNVGKTVFLEALEVVSMENNPSFLAEEPNVDFIPSAGLDEIFLLKIYGKIVDMGLTEHINDFLPGFDSRIKSLIVKPVEGGNIFKLNLKDKKEPVLLSSMGSGLSRYIAIVCAIWKCANGQLFIDEMENGIHYTKYEKLWEIIFTESSKANCQIFLTTHSKECIEAFARIAEKHDHGNIRYVNLSRRVDDTSVIVASVLEPLNIENHFRLGMDVR
jgi:predicted ATPase